MSPNSLAATGKGLPPVRDMAEANIPTRQQARMAPMYEPANVSQGSTVATVQQAIRAAESGNTRELFALYRDAVLSGSHVMSEFTKRKLAVISQPMAIMPADKTKPEDVAAAEACRQAVEDCENWTPGLTHLLDSSLWPVAVVEKIFKPANRNEINHRDTESTEQKTKTGKDGLRWTLRRLEPVNHTLLCFRYGAFGQDRAMGLDGRLLPSTATGQDLWEPDLRFWEVGPDGSVVWDESMAYYAERARHVVHRGHLLTSFPDRFGGPMRAVLFWWLLGTLGRDWFARYMERFGSPWPVAKTDGQNADAVQFLKEALSLSTKVGGLVVDHETEIELAEAMTSGGAAAYEAFLSVCNREQSKVIVGQTLSGTADPTGLGNGTANLQGEVREDVRSFDQKTLGETLRRQLFVPLLEMNGFAGSAPTIVWGGLSSEEAKELGALLVDLSNAGLEPADEAVPTISERVGFEVQRKQAEPAPNAAFGGGAFASLRALSAGVPTITHPSDRFAAEGAAELAAAFRIEFEEVRALAAGSGSAAEFLIRLQHFLPHVKPDRILRVAEPILQKCAASGAAAAAK